MTHLVLLLTLLGLVVTQFIPDSHAEQKSFSDVLSQFGPSQEKVEYESSRKVLWSYPGHELEFINGVLKTASYQQTQDPTPSKSTVSQSKKTDLNINRANNSFGTSNVVSGLQELSGVNGEASDDQDPNQLERMFGEKKRNTQKIRLLEQRKQEAQKLRASKLRGGTPDSPGKIDLFEDKSK
jgi:hypothetical protein